MNPDKDRVRALIAGNQPTCPACDEPKTAAAETWQQWQCGACASWNDKTPSDKERATVAHILSEGEQQAAKALHHLRVALDHACAAQAPRTVARIRLAISSAKGAVRAAGYRAQRQAERANDPIAWRNDRRAADCRPTNP